MKLTTSTVRGSRPWRPRTHCARTDCRHHHTLPNTGAGSCNVRSALQVTDQVTGNPFAYPIDSCVTLALLLVHEVNDESPHTNLVCLAAYIDRDTAAA